MKNIRILAKIKAKTLDKNFNEISNLWNASIY